MLSPDHFRRQCRWLRGATLMVFIGLCLVLSFTFVMGTIGAAPVAGKAATTNIDICLSFVYLLPAAGYLWALWAVQRVLADVAAGRMFHPAVARALRHIGIGVLAGALLKVFAVTNLSRWIAGGQGGYLYFDLAAIVLGVVGAALILLARLVERARELETELEGIF